MKSVDETIENEIGFTKLFSPKRFQDNDKIILNYFFNWI